MAVRISSNIDTKNPADSYATHLGNLTKGGVHTKASIAAMNSIPVQRRERMMLCVVGDTGTGSSGLYWLKTPVNPTLAQLADNQYWEKVPLGTTVDNLLRLQGFQDAGALTILDGTGTTGDAYIVETGGTVTNDNIFQGATVTLQAGDYLIYESGVWNVVGTGATAVTWSTLTGKPTTFTPSPHTHDGTEINVQDENNATVTLQEFLGNSVISSITDINTDGGKIVTLTLTEGRYVRLSNIISNLDTAPTINQIANAQVVYSLKQTVDTKVTNSEVIDIIINDGFTKYSTTNFNTDFATKTTDDLVEGTNKFISQAEKDKIADLPANPNSPATTEYIIRSYLEAYLSTQLEGYYAKGIISTSGSNVTFDRMRKYGYPTAVNQNITVDITNAEENMVQIMKHNAGLKPTYSVPANVTVREISGEYLIGQDNIYFFLPIKVDATNWDIYVSITNE